MVSAQPGEGGQEVRALLEKDKPILARFKGRALTFSGHNTKVLDSAQLSFFTAFWVFVFALPAVSPFLKQGVFGEEHWVKDHYAYMCKNEEIGAYLNVGNKTDLKLVHCGVTSYLKQDKTQSDHAKLLKDGKKKIHVFSDADGLIHHGERVWCGLLPQSYLGYWPNVVQFTYFSVYANTGTTIHFGIQGVVGTFFAVANLFFMQHFFPEGAKGEPYNYWVCVTDMMIFCALIIGSKLAANTKMFALSWHVSFMTNFMNKGVGFSHGVMKIWWLPGFTWDSEPTIVILTSLAGCVIAILATIVPWSPSTLLNIKRVRTDVETVIKALEVVWTEATCYFCGPYQAPKRFQIEGRLVALSSTLGQVEGNLENSWWETFNLFHFGDVRAMYRSFLNTVAQLEHESYCMKDSIQNEDFSQGHIKFASRMKPAIMDLKDEAIELLKICATACSDGDISQQEQADITQSIKELTQKQKTLYAAYLEAMENEPWISADFANENVFLYSLAAWARRITDFALDMPQILANKRKGLAAEARSGVKGILLDIFGVPMNEDYLKVCLANGVPIAICFMIGFYIPEKGFSVFSQYDSGAIMASTLALLIATDTYGSGGFRKNLHRLIGVTIGNIVPRLLLNVMPDCTSPFRFPALGTCIFLYVFVFCYWYYTSAQFSYLGCLIGGFGAYPLLGQCSERNTPEEREAKYATMYTTIANVLIAILVRMIIETIFKREEPRDIAVRKMRELGQAFEASYSGLFEGDVVKMREQTAVARNVYLECLAIAPACDNQKDVVPGFRVDFKYELFNELLKKIRLLLSDNEMLAESMRAWAPLKNVELSEAPPDDDENAESPKSPQTSATSPQAKDVSPSVAGQSVVGGGQSGDISKVHPEIRVLYEMMARTKAFSLMKEDFLGTLQNCFKVIDILLTQETEDPISDKAVKDLENMSGVMELNGVEEFYKELNDMVRQDEKGVKYPSMTGSRRVRLTVATRALRNATRHLGEIDQECLHVAIN